MRIHDAISGLFFLALGLAVFLVSRSFPQMPGQSIGPSTFPTLIGVGMMAGGALTSMWGLMYARAKPLVAWDRGWRIPRRVATVAFCLLGTLAHALWFEQIGFPAGAITLCAGLFLLSGVRKPMVFVLALVFVAAVTVVMTRVLAVPLPMGTWL